MTRRVALLLLAFGVLAACSSSPPPDMPSPLCATKDQKKDGGIGGTGNAPLECPD